MEAFRPFAEPIVCGGLDLVVSDRDTLMGPPPGVYGRLFVGNGATLLLPQVGTYTFCSIKIGRAARLEAVRATIAVEGKLKVGRGGALFGCFCVSQAATSTQVSMLCVE